MIHRRQLLAIGLGSSARVPWVSNHRPTFPKSDRIRDAELQILGWRVLRTTWLQLERAPHEFLDRLRRLFRTAG
jgi:hypothetical protein